MNWHDLRMAGIERHAALLADAAQRRRATRARRAGVRAQLAELIAPARSFTPSRRGMDHRASPGGAATRLSCGERGARAALHQEAGEDGQGLRSGVAPQGGRPVME
jgi:hypothetical protein